jgi:uncharacterized membrane protein
MEVMKTGTPIIAATLLAAACDSTPRRSAECLDEGQVDLESCRAILLPQMDPRPGDENNLICTWGNAVNGSGAVVGETCADRGFSWSPRQPDGSYVQTDPRVTDVVEPTGINRAGDVVGVFWPAVDTRFPFPFAISAGQVTLLPALVDGLSAAALDINDSGTIVGQGRVSQQVVAAVYWQDGEIHRIEGVDALGGGLAGAVAVNEGGTIVGFSNTADIKKIQAFRWDGSGPIEVMPSLFEGWVGEAIDVNDAGVAVGRSGDDFENRAVYWDEDGAIHELPHLYDTDEFIAFAINNDGVIVGYEFAPSDEAGAVYGEARVWIEGEVYDLEDLVPDLPEEYQLRKAVDINDEGQVLAHSAVEDGGPIRNVTLLLRPDLDR